MKRYVYLCELLCMCTCTYTYTELQFIEHLPQDKALILLIPLKCCGIIISILQKKIEALRSFKKMAGYKANKMILPFPNENISPLQKFLANLNKNAFINEYKISL